MLILEQVLRERGWTIQELAYRAKVNGGDLSRILSGRTVPYRAQMDRIVEQIGWDAPASRLLEDVPDDAD